MGGLSMCLAVCLGLAIPRGGLAASAHGSGGPGPGFAEHPSGAPRDSLSDARAARAISFDLAPCLRIARREAEPDEERCPGFIVDGLSGASGAMEQCAQAGGALVASEESSILAIDVNGDGQDELLYDLSSNFGCDGAPSIFSCGSLGCPLFLYERREGQWRAIGALDASSGQAIEAISPAGPAGYRQLRVGCFGEDPCDEFSFYRWTGSAYEPAGLRVRGFWVDPSESVHGLRSLARETPVQATPDARGEVLDRYGAGTDVVVLGLARGAPYYYVSPCNACRSGFVEKSAIGGE